MQQRAETLVWLRPSFTSECSHADPIFRQGRRACAKNLVSGDETTLKGACAIAVYRSWLALFIISPLHAFNYHQLGPAGTLKTWSDSLVPRPSPPFPVFDHLRRTQKRMEKAWWILPCDSWHTTSQVLDMKTYSHLYLHLQRNKTSSSRKLPLEHTRV